jgi:class 3 adenylate cyclase
MTAGVACARCGTAQRDNAKFCDACGSALAARAHTPEYKQVTVLFADVVGSMEIAAAVDPERWREIMTALVERLAAVVRRYGGTVEYTGDGVMALFGAPMALEDHAFRACLAALAIQRQTNGLAGEVRHRDGVELRLRVGLNSGRVIAGEVGSGSKRYAATGTSVGMAQRMESVAPPGGVMLSESTARLVEHAATLAVPEWVRIKGADEPVPARQLIAIEPRHGLIGRAESSLVGRGSEMAALDAVVDRTIDGRGAVVNVVGPPGIGKTRVAREAAALAAGHGLEVVWTFCESHDRDIPFAVVARLLRAATGIAELDGPAARAKVQEQIADADAEDLVLFEDLLTVADPDVALPQIDPDARRRRLTALVNGASLARTDPALFIIEDAHWIDGVSEAMLADFLSVIPGAPLMVLITSRPEYDGALLRSPGAQTITLAPLADSDTATLLGVLLGPDPSVGDLTAVIADRAAGNPFFAEEMVRELVQRGVLHGERGDYACRAEDADVAVPATVQAAIEARIDRLAAPAKRTLSAASVIGARFDAELLAALGIEAVFDELLDVELIDQVGFIPSAEYTFHHPLIRAVAYESQLKSDRAVWHRRLAAAIEERAPGAEEENAALIAEHLQAAGELRTAYGWHMRAAGWSANRDIGAARLSWERALRIADTLPADDPDQLAMRIAPRTMLCATDWQAIREGRGRFAELRELCSVAGDKVSLAIGMTGPATELVFGGHSREGARLVSEQMALLESIGDPAPTMGLSAVAFNNWWDAGEFGELLRWTQTVVELADGDPTKGAGFGIGSPLAAALAWRSVARWWLGRPGWPDDVRTALTMARNSDPGSLALVATWTYGLGIGHGVLRADDAAVHALEEAVHSAQACSDGTVSVLMYAHGVALLNRGAPTDRRRGLELMAQVREMWLREPMLFLIPVNDVWVAREDASSGDRDAAILVMRSVVDELRQAGRIFYGVWATGILVETLLDRAAEGDLAEALLAFEWLVNLAADDSSAIGEITVLRLRALLARAGGDDAAFRSWLIRYRDTAEAFGFDGHIDWAAALSPVI